LLDPENAGFPFAFASAVAVSLRRNDFIEGVWLKSGARKSWLA
jgi:hypothetical protein